VTDGGSGFVITSQARLFTQELIIRQECLVTYCTDRWRLQELRISCNTKPCCWLYISVVRFYL